MPKRNGSHVMRTTLLSVFSDRDAEPLHALANYLLEREY